MENKKYYVTVNEVRGITYEVDAKDRFQAYLKVKNTPSECKVVGGSCSSAVVNDQDIYEVGEPPIPVGN